MYAIGPQFALDAVEERGDGLLHIPFVLTAPGAYPYSIDGRRTMVLKPPEHWHSESFLRSAQGVPFTYEHPREMVTPDTRRDILGLSDSTPARVHADGERVVHGATVFDADLIQAIKGKKLRSVSGGYWVRLESQSGTWTDARGRVHSYDAVQLDPRVNHIAAVKNPRVPNADILLDSEHRAIWCLDWDDPMDLNAIIAKLSTIDQAMADALTDLASAKDLEIETLRRAAHGPKPIKSQDSTELIELRRQFDGLRAERDGLLQKLEQAPTLDQIDEQVRSRLTVVAAVAQKTGAALDQLLDAKDDRELYIRGLTHLKAKFSSDESVDYLRCLVDTFAIQPGKSAADALSTQPQAPTDPRKAADARIKAAQEKQLAELQAARGSK